MKHSALQNLILGAQLFSKIYVWCPYSPIHYTGNLSRVHRSQAAQWRAFEDSCEEEASKHSQMTRFILEHAQVLIPFWKSPL